MKTQSKILKIVAVLMIISGILGIIGNVMMLAIGTTMKSALEEAGVAAPSTISNIITLLGSVVETVAGFMGFRYKDRQKVMIVGIVWVVLVAISTIMTIASSGFSASILSVVVLPILYFWGWYQSN